MRGEKKYVGKHVALFIGVVYAIIWYRIPYIAAGEGWLSVYLPAISLLFAVMLVLTLYSDDTPWLNLTYFFPGVIIGVSIDTLVFHSKASRIAWLFESLSLCVFLAPIAVLATALGRWISRRRKRPGNEIPVHDESETP